MSKEKYKPPLGLIPKHLWIEKVYTQRLNDIREAISRYTKDNKAIPREWKNEHNLICHILRLADSEQI